VRLVHIVPNCQGHAAILTGGECLSMKTVPKWGHAGSHTLSVLSLGILCVHSKSLRELWMVPVCG
jgi:hypothetical protein